MIDGLPPVAIMPVELPGGAFGHFRARPETVGTSVYELEAIIAGQVTAERLDAIRACMTAAAAQLWSQEHLGRA